MLTDAEHTTYFTYIDTPVGKLMLAGCDDHGLRYIAFQCGKGAMAPQGGGEFSDFEIGRAVVYMANNAGGKLEAPAAPAAAASAASAPN